MAPTSRVESLQKHSSDKDAYLIVIVDPDNQFYLTGFKARNYSRPILLLIDQEGSRLVVPNLEEWHAKKRAQVDEVLVYSEHPESNKDATNAYDHLDTLLGRISSRSTVAIEKDFCPVSLFERLTSRGHATVDIGEAVERMRYIKDSEEIATIEEAGDLVNLAVASSVDAAQVGATEIEVDAAGNSKLFSETSRKHPDAILELSVMSPSGPERSAWPHVFSNTRRLALGDTVIHTRQVSFNGYRAELERTVFLGNPSSQQQRAFETMLEAQTAALECIRPGIYASEVDETARRVIAGNGYEDYIVHRVGHGLGISRHEKPYLRFDSSLTLQEGMVYTIEPGIYIPGVGGFRHSDTVVLTSEGRKLVTNYPRQLSEVITR